jgi:hypothetical protein
LFCAEQFQTAYVTNDLDRARVIFKEQYGMENVHKIESDLAAGGHMSVLLAWVGGTMIELIQASGQGGQFYMDQLSPDNFQVRHHHFGYLLADESSWDILAGEVARRDLHVPVKRYAPLTFCYVWAPELHHYLEYIVLDERAKLLFDQVPAN